VPEELRGRAFSGFDVIWQTGRLVSLLAGGVLLDVVGVQAVYVLGGALLLLAAALGGLAAARTRPPPVQSAGT
jgi:MFS family permease